MKTVYITTIAMLLSLSAFAQEKTDTVRFTLGNKKIIIIDETPADSAGTSEDIMAWDPEDKDRKKGKSYESYLWGGLGIGATGYLATGSSISLPPGQEFMELDYARSVGVNLNFLDMRLDIARHGLGLVTGLGLDFRSYAFKNNTFLEVRPDSILAYEDTLHTYDKNKLKSVYLQVPLMVDINTHADGKKALHLGFGVIGGVRIGSKLKQIFEEAGDETKIKTRGHYQLNPFSADLTVRAGYGNLNFYANYGLLTVFEKGKGMDLVPFELGILLHI